MPSPYIDSDYIDALIGGSAVRQRLFTDSGVYSSTADAAVLTAAQAVVDSALSYALEVSVPLSGTIPEIVKLATLGQYLHAAYGRKTLPVPEQWAAWVGFAEGIRAGQVAVPELAADLEEALGGMTASETDESVEGNRAQQLSVEKLDVW